MLETIRQRPRRRVHRQIQRRAASLLMHEMRAAEKQARDREREAAAQAKQEAAQQRQYVAAQRKELAARQKELRRAARELAASQKTNPAALPEVNPSLFKMYQDGELDAPIVALQAAAQGATIRPPRTFTKAALPQPIALAYLCAMIEVLDTTVTNDVQLQCYKDTGTLTRGSPWRAARYDQPPNWPPRAPELAPWLVARAARAVTALPRVLLAPEPMSRPVEAYYLAHALVGLRLLRDAGIGDTFTRWAPHLGAWTVRDHPDDCHQAARDPRRRCTDPRCGDPLPECDGDRAVNLAAYPHVVAPQVADLYRRRFAVATTDPWETLCMELWTTYAEDAWSLANGGTLPFDYSWPPELAVLLALAHYNVWPVPSTPPAALARFLELAAAGQRPNPDKLLRLDELHAAARAAQLELRPGIVAH